MRRTETVHSIIHTTQLKSYNKSRSRFSFLNASPKSLLHRSSHLSPSLRITADISPQVVCCERLLDTNEEDKILMEKIIPHVGPAKFCSFYFTSHSLLALMFISFIRSIIFMPESARHSSPSAQIPQTRSFAGEESFLNVSGRQSFRTRSDKRGPTSQSHLFPTMGMCRVGCDNAGVDAKQLPVHIPTITLKLRETSPRSQIRRENACSFFLQHYNILDRQSAI